MDEIYDLSIPGASEMIITFDARSKTEANYDYVKFFRDASRGAFWGMDKYSGKQWPGANGAEPLVIGAGSCVVYFHSDGSNHDWGFKLTATATVTTREPAPPRPAMESLLLLRLIKSLTLDATIQLATVENNDWLTEAESYASLWPLLLREVVSPLLSSDRCTNLPHALKNFSSSHLQENMQLWRRLCDAKSNLVRPHRNMDKAMREDSLHILQPDKSWGNSRRQLMNELLVKLSEPRRKYSIDNFCLEDSEVYATQLVCDFKANIPAASRSLLVQTTPHRMLLPQDTLRNAIDDNSKIATVKVKLQVYGASTHCRIRVAPSLDAPEAGDFVAGSVTEVTSLVKGFYRLADGRGYVKKDLEGAVHWVRVKDASDNAARDGTVVEAQFMELLEKCVVEKAYRLLCVVIKKGRSVDRHLHSAESPSWSPKHRSGDTENDLVLGAHRDGYLYLLLKVKRCIIYIKII